MMARLDATSANRGFYTKPEMLFHAGRGNGNFQFQVPHIKKLVFMTPPKERFLWLADFNASKSELGRKFGVDAETINRWRYWLATLNEERITWIPRMQKDFSLCRKFEREYYLHGPNWMMKNHELSKAALKGLLLWLRVAGFLEFSFDERIINERKQRQMLERLNG